MTGEKHEGTYKITQGKDTFWFSIEVAHYPRKQWYITDAHPTPSGLRVKRETRRKLDEETWAKLETWL